MYSESVWSEWKKLGFMVLTRIEEGWKCFHVAMGRDKNYVSEGRKSMWKLTKWLLANEFGKSSNQSLYDC